MPVQDDNFFARFARELFQPLAQFQFFRRKKFVAETAEFAERRRLDKNKRTGKQFLNRLAQFHSASDDRGEKYVFVQLDSRAARETFAGT